ncbi:GNAT family N-acetyltransferase [Hydrogenophaga sp.]|uniref:GNAT family N-acetyltransferase n=1 Tax=Hydrogenophaga sp. TaxID=1904254 RepID=UPI002606308D|nr:GNAT family N-acetyltransferase [Hydrogenophaga sp.]MCW5654715.1 N-acetyltransferase [Hydrogenophaga sp.]
MAENDYVTRVLSSPAEVCAADWNALLSREADPSPFMRHEYLLALHDSGCANEATGWQARLLTLWSGAEELQAACPLYLKSHSYGEYVFDWAWADAYARHGLRYYPKALVAVPFTPVPGARLLARDAPARTALLHALLALAEDEKLSSLHLLFAQPQDVAAAQAAGLLLRQTVQFHWENKAPHLPAAPGSAPYYRDFEHFLAGLQQEKRKKIRQERRKVAEAGVRFRWAQGTDITHADWDFFYRCYERTYLEHGNAPYLSRDFFERMASTMPENWLLFVAEHESQPIASSLIGIDPVRKVAYGRYWGALARVDCLHFEACYHQPLAWCIAHGYLRFEGGAQGEHKMARALLPVATTSAHWLAHPGFAEAVERYLAREGEGVGQYLAHLAQRSPLKQAPPSPINSD